MGAALVLNATYEPLCVVPLRRALVLVLAEKAEVVTEGTAVWHSERLALPAPSVVRLSRFVRVPYRRDVPLTRRAVLDRDAHRCVYCTARADTIDHVRPRSRVICSAATPTHHAQHEGHPPSVVSRYAVGTHDAISGAAA